MPSNLLILPLLGGFTFLRKCYYYNVRFQRSEGYWVLLHSAYWGVYFGVAARLLALAASLILRLFGLPAIESSFNSVFPFEFAGTALVAFCMGPALAWIVNWRTDAVTARDLAIDQAGDDLLRLCSDALEQNQAVMFTLSNRKVYVGNVITEPNLETEHAYVTLLPALSGFRKQETLRVEFNVDYIRLWNTGQRRKEDFLTLIPVSEIQVASIFDLEIYDEHFKSKASKAGR